MAYAVFHTEGSGKYSTVVHYGGQSTKIQLREGLPQKTVKTTHQ